MSWAAIAADTFSNELLRELSFKNISVREREGDFFLLDGAPVPLAWARVCWLSVERIPAASIQAAVRALRPKARVFELLPLRHAGRSRLIHQALRPYRRAGIEFPAAARLPEGAGAFTLLDEMSVLFCRRFDRPDPLGRLELGESPLPPSRAYLKLWEALAILGSWPQAGERCLDLGSSPGGWTWALAKLGARVLSVDGAPLDPRVAALPGVEFRKADAFRLEPAETGAVPWLFSDVISAPERLLELVRRWQRPGGAGRMICTIKFRGQAEPAQVAEFEGLGRVMHLEHNKHELCFISG